MSQIKEDTVIYKNRFRQKVGYYYVVVHSCVVVKRPFIINKTEYFGAQEVVYIFLNNIFNYYYLKGNCVLRSLARSPLQKIASLFFGRDIRRLPSFFLK